jgi:hypothetical protein
MWKELLNNSLVAKKKKEKKNSSENVANESRHICGACRIREGAIDPAGGGRHTCRITKRPPAIAWSRCLTHGAAVSWTACRRGSLAHRCRSRAREEQRWRKTSSSSSLWRGPGFAARAAPRIRGPDRRGHCASNGHTGAGGYRCVRGRRGWNRRPEPGGLRPVRGD